MRDDTACAALYGPDDADHGRRHPLEPGAEFRTVPRALALCADGGPDGAFAALTHYRRATPAVTPEQGAVWAYPLPEDSPDEVALTMANALLGRIHLSGRLTELPAEACDLVHEAVAAHKAIRADLPQALPAWPLGLPGWEDPWSALALHTPAATYVTAWRCHGTEAIRDLDLPHLVGADVRVEVLYPSSSQAATVRHPDTAGPTLTPPTAPSAVLLRLTRLLPRGVDRAPCDRARPTAPAPIRTEHTSRPGPTPSNPPGSTVQLAGVRFPTRTPRTPHPLERRNEITCPTLS
ncbi:hypothetical protein ABT187_12555 [Streptomyces sp. NPDC001817]|uniref:hypothetical protein n=1 Tax=Streptomyces sp. NPDC001817 TaxID=3154398 RepID=UPI0033297D30